MRRGLGRFQPIFGRKSVLRMRCSNQCTPPTAQRNVSSSSSPFNTPARAMHATERLLQENCSLTRQLAIKASEYKTLTLYLQNYRIQSDQMIERLTQENRDLLGELEYREEEHKQTLAGSVKELQRLQRQLQSLQQRKSGDLVGFEQSHRKDRKQQVSSIKKGDNQTSEFFESQIQKIVNAFTSWNAGSPQNIMSLRQLNANSGSKHNSDTRQVQQSSADADERVKILQKQVSTQSTDLRILREEIHKLTCDFSQQISKLTDQATRSLEGKQQAEELMRHQREYYEQQLKRRERFHLEYVSKWNSALLAINERSYGSIKNEIQQLQEQNITLSHQLEERIGRLLNTQSEPMLLLNSQKGLGESPACITEKDQEIYVLKQQLHLKQSEVRQVLCRYQQLEEKLTSMLEDNQKIYQISKTVYTEDIQLPRFGYAVTKTY